MKKYSTIGLIVILLLLALSDFFLSDPQTNIGSVAQNKITSSNKE